VAGALERVEGWYIQKSSELTAETKYGRSVRNVKRKRVPGDGSSYSKTVYESQSMCGHVGQPTN